MLKRKRNNNPSPNRNAAARKIQAAWLAKKTRKLEKMAKELYSKNVERNVIRLPRNYTNNALFIPLTDPVVAQFRNGKKVLYTNLRTLKSTRQRNGKYLSPLSRQPIQNFKIRRVSYYGKPKASNNNKNLKNQMKKLSNEQNRLRKGKSLLGTIVNKSQENQNATLARQMQANNNRARNNARALGYNDEDISNLNTINYNSNVENNAGQLGFARRTLIQLYDLEPTPEYARQLMTNLLRRHHRTNINSPEVQRLLRNVVSAFQNNNSVNYRVAAPILRRLFYPTRRS